MAKRIFFVDDESEDQDSDAITSLSRVLLRKASHLVPDLSTAEDVVQNALLKLVEYRRLGKPVKSPIPWLLAVLRTEVSNYYRNSNDLFIDTVVESVPDRRQDNSPPTDISSRKVREPMHWATLPKRLRLFVYALLGHEGRKDEVMEFLGIDDKTFRRDLHRLRHYVPPVIHYPPSINAVSIRIVAGSYYTIAGCNADGQDEFVATAVQALETQPYHILVEGLDLMFRLKAEMRDDRLLNLALCYFSDIILPEKRAAPFRDFNIGQAMTRGIDYQEWTRSPHGWNLSDFRKRIGPYTVHVCDDGSYMLRFDLLY